MSKRRWTSWYPRAWRNRYGEEYEQLLEDLAAEQQLTWRSEVDIAQSGLALRRVYPARRRALTIGFALVLAVGAFVVGFGVRGSSVPHVAVFGSVGPLARGCIVVAPTKQVARPEGAVQQAEKAAAAAAQALRNALRHVAFVGKRAGTRRVVILGPASGRITAECGAAAAASRAALVPAAGLVVPTGLAPAVALRQSA